MNWYVENIKYILTSTFLHGLFLITLVMVPNLNTNSSDKIEVTIISKIIKISKKSENALIHPYTLKPSKTGRGESGQQKTPKIDLKDYADQIKVIVDPVYYNRIQPYLTQNNVHYTTLCLIFVDKYGMIVSIKVIESSGRKDIDQVAIDTFNQVKSLPKPPTLVIEKGIEWEFKF